MKNKIINVKVDTPKWLTDLQESTKVITQLETILMQLRHKNDYINHILKTEDRIMFGLNMTDLLPCVLETYYQYRKKQDNELL